MIKQFYDFLNQISDFCANTTENWETRIKVSQLLYNITMP